MSSFIHQVGQKVGSQMRLLFDGVLGNGMLAAGDTEKGEPLWRMVGDVAKTTTAPIASLTPITPGTISARGQKWRKRDSNLEERARRYLESHAPKLAPLLVVGWNLRMRTTAGVAITSHSAVWLNPALRTISEEEVEKTLLHELAHLLAQHRHGRRCLAPHGPEWMQACIDLGIPGESRTHQLPFVGRRMKRHYLLRCPGCGESHERVRAPRRAVACLSCCRRQNGGIYHECFRFVISRKPEE